MTPVKNTIKSVKPLNEIYKALKEKIVVMASIIIDCVFIFLWVVSSWLVKKYAIPFLEANDFDKQILDLFQVISGLATLLVTLLYMVRDVLVVFFRVSVEIKKEYDDAKQSL